jgi:hypothetical protein
VATTYAELLTEIAAYCTRTQDTAFTSTIPTFVLLFEARLNRTLYDRRKQTTATITMTGGEGALPSDFLALRRVTWQGDPKINLTYVKPEYFASAYDDESGTPSVYTIEGSTITVRPSSDEDIEILYDQKVPALATNSTNWVLDNHPDLYLAGTLVEAHKFLKAPEAAVLWDGVTSATIDQILAADNNSRGPLHIRPIGIPIV